MRRIVSGYAPEELPRRILCAVASVAVCLVASGESLGRTWKHASGQYQVEAELVTVKYGKIWLLRSAGGVFGVTASELSEADQAYVQEWQRKRAAEKLPLTPNPPGRVPYGPGRELAQLENAEIDESSGLARSQRHANFFWTHNDSGGDARVYLTDIQGRARGSFLLRDVLAYDFEDIFSFTSEGKHYLVVCDVGNNGRAAPIQMLHIVEEPSFNAERGLGEDLVVDARTVYYSYEDDHRDCEAVGIDPTSRTILMVTRERESPCHVYQLVLPEPNPRKAFAARQIATLQLPAVTGLDVSSDGQRVVISTYGHAYEFTRGPEETWSEGFAREPRQIVLPERVQGESIAFGADDKTLYLTSEKRPAPLLVVPVLDANAVGPVEE